MVSMVLAADEIPLTFRESIALVALRHAERVVLEGIALFSPLKVLQNW